MSLLMLGISHRTATLPLLEQVALRPQDSAALAARLLNNAAVSEALVLATCNRIEMYAEVSAFHPGILHLGQCFAEATGVPLEELAEHLVVRYADRVVAHLFTVACGLESMAIGEGQVLGQLRQALRQAQENQQAGTNLEQLVQQALRVGKRAHAETGLDQFSGSLIDAGIVRAESALGPLAKLRVLILGAGSMSALAASVLSRSGVAELIIVNRTLARAEHLAQAVAGRALPWSQLPTALVQADLIIACTGATDQVIDSAQVQSAQAARDNQPQHFLDLALPRDIAPEVNDLPQVLVTDLSDLGEDLAPKNGADLAGVEELVAAEVSEFLAARRAQSVAPTVAALRERAANVVSAELDRLAQRMPDLEPERLAELQATVHRVVEKILHAPTVRVKELASRTDGAAYAGALRELFDLPEGPNPVAVADLPKVTDLAALLTGKLTEPMATPPVKPVVPPQSARPASTLAGGGV